MPNKVIVDQTALLKIILHALKYPTTGVNGILLGEHRSSGASGSGSGEAPNTVHVYDCIPVCHSHITLTPLLEIALAQVLRATSTPCYMPSCLSLRLFLCHKSLERQCTD
jgi:Uncharacterised protein family (UPF0172)